VEWEKELHEHLESADIILLLISPDFMASDYCYSTEMGRAIARHNEGSAVVIPMILRSTFWQNAPFAKLQIIPKDAKPVTNWLDRDDALHDVTLQVNQVVLKLYTKRAQIKVDEDYGESQPQSKQPVPAQNIFRVLAFDPAELTLLRTLTNTSSIWRVAISPDSQTLVSGDEDGIIKFWELPSGKELRTLTSHTDFVYDIAVSPTGKILASGSRDNTIKLWGMKP